MPPLKRYRFFKTENQYSGRCPAGMSEDMLGPYCKVDDVSDDLELAQLYRELERRLKQLGHGSIDHHIAALEAEYQVTQQAKPRLIVSDATKDFVKVKHGDDFAVFPVLAVSGNKMQLRVNAEIAVWVTYANHTPKEGVSLVIDRSLCIVRIIHDV